MGLPCLLYISLYSPRLDSRKRHSGLSPEDIITELPHLSLAQVYAALTYYHANREEIEADIIAEATTAERLAKQHNLQQNTP